MNAKRASHRSNAWASARISASLLHERSSLIAEACPVRLFHSADLNVFQAIQGRPAASAEQFGQIPRDALNDLIAVEYRLHNASETASDDWH